MEHHRLEEGLRYIVKPAERDAQDAIPILRRHKRKEIIAPDARVVDQYLDVCVGMRICPRLQRLRYLGLAAHVEAQQLTRLPSLAHEFERPCRLFFVTYVINQHMIAHLGQLDADGPADASASARH